MMLVEIACCDISEQTWTATQLGAAHQFIYFFKQQIHAQDFLKENGIFNYSYGFSNPM